MKTHTPTPTAVRVSLALAVMIGAMLLVPSMAAASITVDGNMSDWGVHPGPYGDPSQWTPNAGVSFFQQDHDPAVSFLGPGWGGQAFDAEAAYFTRQGDTAYFAVVTGFPLTGQPGYSAGDLAIDFGSNGSYEFGVQTGLASSHDLYGNATWSDPTLFPGSGPVSITGGTNLGGVQFGYDSTSYLVDGHYVFEVGIPIALFGSFWDGYIPDFTAHWTMSCGNNAINLHVSPVPEPVSSILLLMGFGGLAFTRRRAAKSIS